MTTYDPDNIFARILRGEIPSERIYEDAEFIVIRDVAGSVRRNFVLGPATFVTGCRPIVFVTTPPHPASKARMMLLSDSVGGADESRNGFLKRSPVKVTDRSALMKTP